MMYQYINITYIKSIHSEERMLPRTEHYILKFNKHVALHKNLQPTPFLSSGYSHRKELFQRQ
jgi:hypothetical protein